MVIVKKCDMKKLLLLLSFFGLQHGLKAQSSTFNQIKEFIALQKPDLILQNKLIAFTVWQVSDMESRECNKAFEKAYNTYYKAKLKGGENGFVVISINKDNLSELAIIAYKKDGIKEMFSVKLSDLNMPELNQIKNQIFDANGAVLFTNLPSSSVFSSVHSLITR